MKLLAALVLVVSIPAPPPDASYEIDVVEINQFSESCTQAVFFSLIDGELVLRGWCWEKDVTILPCRGGYEIRVEGVNRSLWARKLMRSRTDYDVEVISRPGLPLPWLKR